MPRAIRFLIATLIAFFAWSAVPAYANNVPTDEVAIGCTGVTLDWHDFPTHPVDLTVSVTFDDQNSTNVISTGGARDGKGAVPLELHGTGSASVLVEWTLRKEHHSGPVTADLTCEATSTTTTPTSTTNPPTSPTVPHTFRMIPPATAGPELPNTGADTWLLVLGGWMLVGMGAAVLWGARVRRDEQ